MDSPTKYALMTARDTTKRAMRQIEMAVAVLEYQSEVSSTHAERNTLNKYAEYLMRDAIDGMARVVTKSASAINNHPPEPEELPF